MHNTTALFNQNISCLIADLIYLAFPFSPAVIYQQVLICNIWKTRTASYTQYL